MITFGTGLAVSAFDSSTSRVMRDGTGAPTLGLGELKVLGVSTENLAGILGHWTVKEDGNVRQRSFQFQLVKVKQQSLHPPHRKGGDDHRSAAGNRAVDNLRQRVCRMALVVSSIAISRFDQQIVGPLDRYGINHDGVVESTEIAGEDGRDPGPIELN